MEENSSDVAAESGDVESQNRSFWSTAKIVATVLTFFATWTTSIYYFVDHLYESRLESLESSLQTVTQTYKELSLKAEGLLKPELWKEDTLRLGSSNTHHNTMQFRGGLIRFVLKSINTEAKLLNFHYQDRVDGLTYLGFISMPVDQPLDRLTELDISLAPYERFEFAAEEQQYYFQAWPLEGNNEKVVAQIYRLESIYRTTSGDSAQ